MLGPIALGRFADALEACEDRGDLGVCGPGIRPAADHFGAEQLQHAASVDRAQSLVHRDGSVLIGLDLLQGSGEQADEARHLGGIGRVASRGVPGLNDSVGRYLKYGRERADRVVAGLDHLRKRMAAPSRTGSSGARDLRT